MSTLTKADILALRERSENAVEELNESRRQDQNDTDRLEEGAGNTIRRKQAKQHATSKQLDKAINKHNTDTVEYDGSEKGKEKLTKSLDRRSAMEDKNSKHKSGVLDAKAKLNSKKTVIESDELLDLAAELIDMAEQLDEMTGAERRKKSRAASVNKRFEARYKEAGDAYDAGDTETYYKIGTKGMKDAERADNIKKRANDARIKDENKKTKAKNAKVTESKNLQESARIAATYGIPRKHD